MQTQDDAHLDLILNTLKVNDGDSLLDLGTGSGYLAFNVNKTYPNLKITGLDIVEQTLKSNIDKAESDKIHNIKISNLLHTMASLSNACRFI